MHITKVICLSALCCLTGSLPAQHPPAAATNRADEVVARVGATVIQRRELDMAMRAIQMDMARRGRGIPAEMRARFEHDVLNEMVDRELLLLDCAGKNFPAVEEQVKQQMADTVTKAGGEAALAKMLMEAGLTLPEYTKKVRDNLLIETAMETLVREKVKISTNDVRGFYDSNQARFRRPEMVRASHILVMVPRDASEDVKAAKRTQIEAARTLVKNGEKFADVASKVSEDPGSGSKGGDLGFFARGQMVPEFELAAFSLKTNQVSEVITTQFGYHVLLVTDHRDAELLPFEKVQPEIEKHVRSRRGSEVAVEYVKSLREKTKPEILLPPLPAAATSLPAPAPRP